MADKSMTTHFLDSKAPISLRKIKQALLQHFTRISIYKQESCHGTCYMRLNKHIKMFNVE